MKRVRGTDSGRVISYNPLVPKGRNCCDDDDRNSGPEPAPDGIGGWGALKKLLAFMLTAIESVGLQKKTLIEQMNGKASSVQFTIFLLQIPN